MMETVKYASCSHLATDRNVYDTGISVPLTLTDLSKRLNVVHELLSRAKHHVSTNNRSILHFFWRVVNFSLKDLIFGRDLFNAC